MQGFATGLVYGDQVTLEYYLPNEVEEVGIISISGIVHGYKYILPEYGYGNVPGSGFNLSGNCQVNINCPEGNNWQNEKRAVALIIVGGSRMCTGSLINNANNDNHRYFLTADHCLVNQYGSKIYDAIDNPNLINWTFYWNYELPPNPNDCNYNSSTPSAPLAFSTSGAKVLANDTRAVSSDFALLELDEDPRFLSNYTPSYIPYYLGWDRTGNSGTGGVGIHHPRGDVNKIATYNQTPQTSGNYWSLYWIQTTNGHSVTEPGSSGSPLINSDHRVIGQLWGGSIIYCEAPANKNSIYGKFSVSWTGTNGTTDNRRKLQPWLDPNNSVTILNGISCPTVVNFTGQPPVTSSRTIRSCGDINIQNVTVTGNNVVLTLEATGNINVQDVNVQNNAKLILDAAGKTNIISGFKVELGSEFKIIKK